VILLIDNYDSFTFNLAQLLAELGQDLVVVRNDERPIPELVALAPSHVVISPGPGRPEDAGVTLDVVRAFAGRTPLLGVCLGHQAIGLVYGGRVVAAPELVHGKAAQVRHDGRTIFAGLPETFPAGRYHSLIVDREGLPPELEVSARSADGLVMGLRHRALPLEGVQFHPESILTPCGKRILENFVRLEPSVRSEPEAARGPFEPATGRYA
jgi:anthranilate synthase/aminodeoxychorismate synthase-like glutamine amidotransferase